MLTVTFQNSSRFEGALPDRREAGRPRISFEADVFGTRQEYNALTFGVLK